MNFRTALLIMVTALASACSKPKPSVLNDPKEQSGMEEIPSSYLKVDIDFLTACDSLEMWLGGIQGVNQSDSIGPYILGECHTNKHYDVIVYHQSRIALDVGTNYQENRIVGDIQGADYFVFEMPKKYPSKTLNDDVRFDYIFRTDVKINRRIGKQWYLIGTKQVKSFEELGRLKLNTIFSANR